MKGWKEKLKGMTEGAIGTLIGVIIAIIVIYALWRIYGGK